MKQSVNASPGIFQRCPHLGLHDDRSTSLAYPSAWNYCYRATPPESVSSAHQETVCLTAAHMQCPILLRATQGPLPPNLQGDQDVATTTRRNTGWIFMIVLLILAIVAGVFLLPRFVSTPTVETGASPTIAPPTNTSLPTYTSTATVMNNPAQGIIASFTADAKTRIAGYTNTPKFTGTPPTATITPTSTRTSTPTKTFTPTKTPTRTLTPTITLSPLPTSSPTMVPPPANGVVCGHPLDTPFGSTTKFLLHRILPGENLTIYADTYGTSTTAILAVNYRLPLPVWADWVVVIPFQTTDVSGAPLFEPYQAVDARISVEELARQLNTDVNMLKQYNGFQQPCGSFSGWLLVPRPVP